MQKILSDEENLEYILDNFPGFLMASGGNSQDVSSILIGRPSKVFKVKEEKDLESTLEKFCDDHRQKLNPLTLSIKGHALAVEGTLKKNGKTFFMVRNPWGSGNKNDFVTTESDKLLEGTEYSNFNKDYYVKTGKALFCANDIKTSFFLFFFFLIYN